MWKILQFITDHPLNRDRRLLSIARLLRWQVFSRTRGEVIHPWINGTKLVVRKGMTGATGNIYCGLHEFSDMGFLIHFLRPSDTFIDIGANIGSYTILASGVCGANTIAFEPDPITMTHLARNIAVNQLESLVAVHNVALGRDEGEVLFTIGLDTINRVATASDPRSRSVPLRMLDTIPGANCAKLIKLDVEGYEAEVLAGGLSVLNSQDLLAVETESDDASVTSILSDAGFVRRWYDPRTRVLAAEPIPDLTSSNALYLRDELVVAERLRTAPTRLVHGRML